MIDEANKEMLKFTFQKYIEWVFNENQGTYKWPNYNSIQKTNIFTTAIQDDKLGDIIWLFRKCLNEKDLDNQNKAFLELQHIIRHIFLFLLLLAQQKYDEIELTTLMNSIGILNDNTTLCICLSEPDLNILKQTFSFQSINQQGNKFQKNFSRIVQIWSQLKDVNTDSLNLPGSDFLFLEDLQRLNVCFNMDQMNMIREKKKQKEKEKKQQEEREKQMQIQRMFQSSLRKEQIHSVKIVKMDCKKSQSLFLQPNGNIVKGKIWFPQNISYLCPLWMSYDFEILSFYNNNNLNSDLKQYCGFVSYKGPVNDYFEPQTYDFDNEIEGIMKTSQEQGIYKGGFKNGLFDGRNRVYFGNTLNYYGGFKNGQKHGEGYAIESQQQKTYMKGQYESNLKQGLFVDYECTDFNNREKQFKKIGRKLEYYKNGIKYDKIPADYQQQYNVNQNPSCNLLNFNEYGINNFQLASLRPGGWINSSVIDILLNQLITLINYSNNANKTIGIPKNKTIFINCSHFQDIFGSMITKDEKINHKVFNEIYDLGQSYSMKDNQCVKNNDKDIRIVFYFNLDRSHFLTAVYESQKLYLIDSLKDKRKAVTHQIIQFLQFFGLNADECDNLNISQQQNSYDCGAYTIYYVSQIIKHQHLRIQEMIEQNVFVVAQPQINYLRHLIYQNLIGNGASIAEL